MGERDATIVVGTDGIVRDATGDAARWLGARVGRRCPDVVDVRPAGSRSPCRAGCTAELVAGGRPLTTIGTVRGRPRRVTCTPLGGCAVVRLEEIEAADLTPPTPREREVLACVARGLTTREAAEVLGIGFATARTHLERVRARLGARTRAEAVSLAERMGWLDG